MSQREAARRFGIDRKTVAKLLAFTRWRLSGRIGAGNVG